MNARVFFFLFRFTKTCKKMTNLLRSVVTVIDVFYKYTKQDGECGTLSKDELKELLEKEFRPILKVRTMYQE